MNSYGNVALTSQISLHKSLKANTVVKPSDIASSAVNYSLFFNNLVYVAVFVLLKYVSNGILTRIRLGTSSWFPVAVNYAFCSTMPLVLLAYLTIPKEV